MGARRSDRRGGGEWLSFLRRGFGMGARIAGTELRWDFDVSHEGKPISREPFGRPRNYGNYGDTPSNTDGVTYEGVGTSMRRGQPSGPRRSTARAAKGPLLHFVSQRTTVAMHNGDLSLRDVRDILEQAKPSRKAFLEAAPSPQLRPPNQAIAAHRNKNLRIYINLFLSTLRCWCAR